MSTVIYPTRTSVTYPDDTSIITVEEASSKITTSTDVIELGGTAIRVTGVTTDAGPLA